jgi:hypothetical protein
MVQVMMTVKEDKKLDQCHCIYCRSLMEYPSIKRKSLETPWLWKTSDMYRLFPIKGKVVSVILKKHHANRGYWGSRVIAPRIVDLGTR